MKDLIKEIKILKKLVKAQDRMIMGYRTGSNRIPEYVFNSMDKAKEFYNVQCVSEIK